MLNLLRLVFLDFEAFFYLIVYGRLYITDYILFVKRTNEFNSKSSKNIYEYPALGPYHLSQDIACIRILGGLISPNCSFFCLPKFGSCGKTLYFEKEKGV